MLMFVNWSPTISFNLVAMSNMVRPIYAYLLCAILSNLIAIVSALDWRQGLEELRSGDFKLLFLDYMVHMYCIYEGDALAFPHPISVRKYIDAWCYRGWNLSKTGGAGTKRFDNNHDVRHISHVGMMPSSLLTCLRIGVLPRRKRRYSKSRRRSMPFFWSLYGFYHLVSRCQLTKCAVTAPQERTSQCCSEPRWKQTRGLCTRSSHKCKTTFTSLCCNSLTSALRAERK